LICELLDSVHTLKFLGRIGDGLYADRESDFSASPPGLKSGDQIVTTTPQKKVKQDATRKQKPFYSLNDATSCYTLLIASRPLTQWKSLVRIQCRPSIISRGYRLRSVGSFCFCYPNKPTQEKTRDNKRKISCQFSY